ncbi:hypothetical protein NXC24_PB00197 (plasmid) [Rhizobium sp. NXC24]|nr:hypothetical protein NXC24_PB00197 [Rhizobium sp. NXC24]
MGISEGCSCIALYFETLFGNPKIFDIVDRISADETAGTHKSSRKAGWKGGMIGGDLGDAGRVTR